MKKGNPKQQVIASLEKSSDEKQVIDKRMHLVANYTVTIPPYQISVVPLILVTNTCDTNLRPHTLLEIEETPFLSIDQQNMKIIPILQKLGFRMPDEFMAVLWNPGGQAIILKRNTTISNAKESDYVEKIPPQAMRKCRRSD